jgi:hypothetical protein
VRARPQRVLKQERKEVAGRRELVKSQEMKVVGIRKPGKATPEQVNAFLKMVIALRGDKPFIPKGVHRFLTFEESNAWSIKMMARKRNHGRRP